ncbi:tRNA (adenosine(37)-N6)-dimethylallyltransferase MiaA [Legionella sp. MW5194]|uniref:tRNA (adenosine(37)-N6)-dimethylallyltransferase MiaA n=1 Tax=Legionella sp. MW5194 TaxID=2662448 RepID=UPI00193C995F|nr:tRNA (adenosine(37)-N6)-dimethylallyltransferase MiaA [Legionella sp. MW5194]QRN02857.1 tRNA (adenosine(37)-N6)-dimethylallyltransferase MiaA [Legionella sp. MW5194]
MPETVLCLMGPTASGKTALACDLAQRLPVEIISVDSAMIYRGMDIGTAKPTADELLRAPHQLLDILDPPDSFSAAEFCQAANHLIEGIHARGKIPLLVGGTMMYFHALQQGLSDLPEADDVLRQQLLKQAEDKGWAALHRELADVDAVAAARIHPNDTQRIQRALEVFYLTGKPLSHFLEQGKGQPRHRFVNCILFPNERAWLHERIALRFDAMLKQGFVEEVRQLMVRWPLLTPANPSMRLVGYRQALDYLAGRDDHEQFRDKGIAATRQLAKRQLTWLRGWPHGCFFSCDKPDITGEFMAKLAEILDNSPQKSND